MPYTVVQRSTNYISANAIQDGSSFCCVACGETYNKEQPAAWRQHVKVKHPEFTERVEVTRNSLKKKHHCPDCDYMGQKNKYLKEHIARMHGPSRKERPQQKFPCPHCTSSFTAKTNRSAHLRYVCKNIPVECLVVSTCMSTMKKKTTQGKSKYAKIPNPSPTLIPKLNGLSQLVKCKNFTKATEGDLPELLTENESSEATMRKPQPFQLLTLSRPDIIVQIVDKTNQASRATIPDLVPLDQRIIPYRGAEEECGIYDLSASWTQEEKHTFKTEFLKHYKDFLTISMALPGKTKADCIVYYYRNKKKPEWTRGIKRKLARLKSQNRRNRELNSKVTAAVVTTRLRPRQPLGSANT